MMIITIHHYYNETLCTDLYKVYHNLWQTPVSELLTRTAEKMKFSINDFFSKYDQIRRKLRIWSHILKKSLMENFIFSAVTKRQFL